MKKKAKIGRGILVVLIMLVFLAPFYILLSVAFRSPDYVNSYWIFPKSINFANFVDAIENGKIFECDGEQFTHYSRICFLNHDRGCFSSLSTGKESKQSESWDQILCARHHDGTTIKYFGFLIFCSRKNGWCQSLLGNYSDFADL